MMCTTIDQGKLLLGLGINSKTADMHYVRKTRTWDNKPVNGEFGEPKYGGPNSKYARYIVQNFSSYEVFPAWSLVSLIELLPLRLDYKDSSYKYRIFSLNNKINVEYYCLINSKKIIVGTGDTIIDSVIDSIKWLISGGFIKL